MSKRGSSFHKRTPSMPIPSILINSPVASDDPDGDNNESSQSLDKAVNKRLQRSVSSIGGYDFGGSRVTEEEDGQGSKSGSQSAPVEQSKEGCTEGPSPQPSSTTTNTTTGGGPSVWTPVKHLLLHPLNFYLQKEQGQSGKMMKRQRSKSYSDLYARQSSPMSSSGGGDNDERGREQRLPELTLLEVKAILRRHRLNRGDPITPSLASSQASINSDIIGHVDSIVIPPPPPLPPTPLMSALLPAASLASLDERLLATGIKNLKPTKTNVFPSSSSSPPKNNNGSGSLLNVEEDPGPPQTSLKLMARRTGPDGRPRMLSQPTCLIPDSIHTAPMILNDQNPNNVSGPLQFFKPYFNFRRPSQTSTHGLILAESMVSLTHKALVSFITEDNLAGLQHLLESRRVVVDDRDESGCTALMVAAHKGKVPFVRTLLEHGAEINAEDEDAWSPLLFAAKEGHDEIVVNLLEHGAVVDHRDMGGWTPLMWTCYKGKAKSARLLIERGADVNAYGTYNVSCLGWAAGRGYAEIVKDLLSRGAKVNNGDKYGTTPLIWAARKGFPEIVDMLLSYGANVDACGMSSWTPLLVAAAGNHVEVVKAILDRKANVNALDKDGCSGLTIACNEGFFEVAVSLISHGAYININDRGGTSNLIHASKGGHKSIVEVLLKKHADINVQGKDRKTALYWAVEKSHVPVVKLLLSAAPDLEQATKDGDTPLMKAVRNRNSDIVSLLLDKRAKVSVADKNGDTCLHIAMRARSRQIVDLLLRNPAHSQLLYRPNRAGETPYNIDRASPKPIIPQIFGSRGLNTQEDGENLLGYNLYSSALADMLSDPTLNMPITVGLFARWGSGKSFLLSKLRDEMKSFARQWLNPLFTWSSLVLLVILCLSCVVGVSAGLASQSWMVGVGAGAGVTLTIHALLFVVWWSSNRSKYDWSWSSRLSSYLALKSASLQLVCQVIFCHPPGSQSADTLQAQPINFYFTEQTKISSTTGGENSVVQMLGSLYTCIENDYGVLASRLFRAFRPRPVAATSDWKWRKLCCIPYCVIFLFTFMCSLIGIVMLVFHLTGTGPRGYGSSLSIAMYVCALIVGLLLVANLYTVGQVLKALIFSHRTHLQKKVARIYTVKAEGSLHALKQEVNLMTDMINCLDAFTSRQTRLVVIVDGLDSAEQEKVLQVLDAVHMLFSSDVKAPFIILLAIDPHIIAKGIEMNINPVLNESNIGAHDYLRNLVHLPFFLQNAALRKVKHVKMLESSMKRNSRLEDDPGPQIILSTRRPSVESGFGIPLGLLDSKPSSKTNKAGGNKRLGLRMSESVASSVGSNLNKVTSGMLPMMGGGPSDLKKMLLGDDYFSDVNPRSMRRLMNIIHITGRLLKCFSIDFNWYHLSAWVNVTEQWPYRLSWVIIYCEHYQKDLDDGVSLKQVYERVRPFIPTAKEIDSNVSLDRDEKKLDIYLGMHKASLLVSTLYVFLPFTISLDPQLRKDIAEQYQPGDLLFKSNTNIPLHQHLGPFAGIQSPQAQALLRYRGQQQQQQRAMPQPTQQLPPPPQLYSAATNGYYPMWYPQGPYGGMPFMMESVLPQPQPPPPPPTVPVAVVPAAVQAQPSVSGVLDPVFCRELKTKTLSSMTVDGVCDLLKALSLSNGCGTNPSEESSQMTKKYQDTVRTNNINGRVLLNCDLSELKQVLQMSFGDWEMFKCAMVLLREAETKSVVDDATNNNNSSNSNSKEIKISVTSPGTSPGHVAVDGLSSPRGSRSPLPVDQNEGLHKMKPPTGQPQPVTSTSVSTSTLGSSVSVSYIKPNVLEKQVTMEEQMICGALELLNDEAKEDALKGEDDEGSSSPSSSPVSSPTPTHLSPINSESETHSIHKAKRTKKGSMSRPNSLIPGTSSGSAAVLSTSVGSNTGSSDRRTSKPYLPPDETDVLYVVGNTFNVTAELPDSPSIIRKLSEAEASSKFSILNEVSYPTSDPISIPYHPHHQDRERKPSWSRKSFSGGGSRRHPTRPSFPKNLSFSENVTTMSTSPPLSTSLTSAASFAASSSSHHHHHRPLRSPTSSFSSSTKDKKEVSKSFAAQFLHSVKKGKSRSAPGGSSSDTSSDESQKPLVMKPIPSGSSSGRKAVITVVSSKAKSLSRNQSGESQSGGSSSRSQSPNTKKKGKSKQPQRQDSIASKLAKSIKSSLFGPSPQSQSQQQNSQEVSSPSPPEGPGLTSASTSSSSSTLVIVSSSTRAQPEANANQSLMLESFKKTPGGGQVEDVQEEDEEEMESLLLIANNEGGGGTILAEVEQKVPLLQETKNNKEQLAAAIEQDEDAATKND